MKKLIKLSLIVVVIASSFFFSACDDEQLNSLSDIIFIRNDKADMPAYIYGNGSNKIFIVVLHGGPGGNALEYRLGKYSEALENDFAMVYWDQRGQGMTQSNGSKSLINVEQFADDLEKLLLVLKNRYGQDAQMLLMGHSWGGTLGTYFLLNEERQQLVNGWIEVDGAHDIVKLSKESLEMIDSLGIHQINQNHSVDDWQALINWTHTIAPDSAKHFTREINQKSWEAIALLENDEVIAPSTFTSLEELRPLSLITSFFSGAATANLLFEEIEKIELTDQLYKINIPCLFLWGKYDVVVSPQLAEDAFELVSSDLKFIHIFEKSAHSPMSTEPDLYVKQVKDFVQTIQ